MLEKDDYAMSRLSVIVLLLTVFGSGSLEGAEPVVNRLTVICDAFGNTDLLRKD